MDVAGPRDIELAENVQKIASEHRQRNMAANNSEDIWGRRDAAEAKRKGQEFEEISHEEYRLRRQRAVASLGDLPKEVG